MRERQEENSSQIENEYDLIQAMKLANGTHEWLFKPGKARAIMQKLKDFGYDTSTKIESVASQFRLLGTDSLPNYDYTNRLFDIISRPCKRHLIIPFGRNEDFVGRVSILEELIIRIPPSTKGDICQRTAIKGLGGVGKTQVALEAAYQVYEHYLNCSIFWVPAVTMSSFENAYREIGKVLNTPGIDDDKADVKSLVKTAIENYAGNWLLVLDNADDTELLFGSTKCPCIREYLPSNARGSILFTTRSHEIATKFHVQPKNIRPVEKLSNDEGIDMLQNKLDKSQMCDEEHTKKLLEFLTYFPLAIKQASAYMAQTQMTTIRYLQFCNSSDELQVELLSKEFDDLSRYPESKNPVVKTWLISFNHIARDNPLAARYLKFICFLAEKDIPISLLPPGERQLEKDEALGVLTGYAFITRRKQGDSCHNHV